jgi:hypothetical protein
MQQMAACHKATRPYPAGRCHALVGEAWTTRAIPASRIRGNNSQARDAAVSRHSGGSDWPAPQN